MDKLLNKWYFGLIALPILINLLTNSIGLPDLFKDWSLTIIISLSFLIIVLLNELTLFSKKIKELNYKPKKSDKKIIEKLLNLLDIDAFHEDIKEQDSWYGYRKDSIKKILEFKEAARLISNKTSDTKLNKLILDLKNALDDFCSFSSKELYGNGDFYSPAKDSEFNLEKAEKAQPVMNAKAEFAFLKLTLLLDYLKCKHYFE